MGSNSEGKTKVRKRVTFKEQEQKLGSDKKDTSKEISTEKKTQATPTRYRCSLWIVMGWTCIISTLILFAFFTLMSFSVLYDTSVPPELDELILQCSNSKEQKNCKIHPNIVYDAVSQLLLLDKELVQRHIPNSVVPLSLLGKTIASLQITRLREQNPSGIRPKEDFQIDLTLLATRGYGGYIGSWVIDQRVTSSELQEQSHSLGHRVQLLHGAVVNNCSGVNNYVRLTERLLNLCISPWRGNPVANQTRETYSLENHSFQFFAGDRGESLYTTRIHSADLHLIPNIEIAVDDVANLQELRELVQTAYRIPYAIAFHNAQASFGPAVIFSDSTQSWQRE